MSRIFSVLLLSLPLALSADFESVTISANLDNVGHTCISKCLYYTLLSDMGRAMGCDDPYDNNCYCATAAASANKADGFMSKCATSLCSAGDRSRDLTSMQSYYASYCMGAGFTQPGATEWYNPAEATEEPTNEPTAESGGGSDARPSRTANSGGDGTSTHMTIVTQTAEDGASRTQVIVEATSTYWVNSDGSPASSKNEDGGTSVVKIGVGIAVPVVVIAAGLFAWWFIRRRNQQKAQYPHTTQPLGEVTTGGGPAVVASVSPATPERRDTLPRKPVGASTISSVSSLSKTNELSGIGVQRELSGREVHPFPNMTPSPPIQVAGQHEMSGEGWRPNLEMDGRDARVEMSGEARPPELPGYINSANAYTPHESVQRWELPDNSRQR
ncbi:hypothetical protein FOCG_04011 [Fusarium oxysporum f. sp. radicis-lycopersici 26381]|uniref:Extracellular membrane protein CFEM domain-containing protein n=3 Tax=Fusarium oxysporum TaxID=5507 RepID=A0A2H3HCH4_FUSOX|nr:uncharacterized protein FOBCDRAFT_319252 [Fusarium oxysporum Fo47]EXL56379.1 hypothetical protein FOCG_04011 [Fusarium oxysporum f. sp. radicis-lycopersici 26381]KAF5267817.1 hypothetical protein FOXYS1_1301 [Fusarium oxysporum]KAH7481546.1 hypothetical protein FOMA001_g8580 [Fusarium oxysporum f. sp. matthiolae]PCD35019.1 hypothetical protein AU210_007608 [Fusarium oxysporum f. sp. radicis-cucumerinum]EWZ36914.1 hypothetical protein FOZG_10828 [Fusarium oxysporum Fo47]